MGQVLFVTGGARSGKSRFALERARQAGGKVAFVASAQVRDDEMRARVARHRAARPAAWETVEEPLEIAAALERLAAAGADTALVDCLTIWTANLLEAGREAELPAAAADLVAAARKLKSLAIIVSNEVGAGVVPDNPLARRFRDLAGEVNQLAAAAADEAYLLASGLPLRLK